VPPPNSEVCVSSQLSGDKGEGGQQVCPAPLTERKAALFWSYGRRSRGGGEEGSAQRL